VYVADRENKRVQVFGIDGKYVNQYVSRAGGGYAGGIGLSADPAQEFLYVAAAGGQIQILRRKTLESVGFIGGQGILGGGHHLSVDPKGNIYTAQSGRGAQKLTYKGLTPAH
jgi:DNA-binding beta-propeller fold protein YncE